MRCAAVAHVFLASSLGEAGSVVDPEDLLESCFFPVAECELGTSVT